MAKRLIISIILAFALVAVARIVFNIFPISIFPCTITHFSRETIDTLCGLRDINTPPQYVTAELTPSGEVIRFLVTIIIPIILGFYIEYLTKPKLSSAVLKRF
jgi:uncharacterized membrane protein